MEHGTHEKTDTVLVDLGIKGNSEAKIKVTINIVARTGIKPGFVILQFVVTVNIYMFL